MAKILMVDDSRTSRKILKDILVDAGHEIVGEAGNGEEGYQMYGEVKPDLVTMDITMPVLDGIEALKKIKTEGKPYKDIIKQHGKSSTEGREARATYENMILAVMNKLTKREAIKKSARMFEA